MNGTAGPEFFPTFDKQRLDKMITDTPMFTQICPKLPMRNKQTTLDYYARLGFSESGAVGLSEYAIVERDGLELHFFEFRDLDPAANDGQVYIRVSDIDQLYSHWQEAGVAIHPNGALGNRPWGQREFALLDPDHNLLTFGEAIV